MIQKTMARLGAALALAAILIAGLIPAAQAAQATPASASVSVAQVVRHDGQAQRPQNFSVCQSNSGASNSNFLPVNRWQGATNELHSRLEGGINVGSFMGTIHRDFVVGSGMSFGNFLWSQGANLAEFAVGFCMLNTVGGAADGIAKQIGDVMFFGAGLPILAFLIVVSIIAVVVQGLKGSIRWGSLFQKAIVVGLLAFMTLGSVNSTGGGINGNNSTYKPGVGSPGWIVTTVNNTIASLASAPAMAFSIDPPDTSNGGLLSCKNYVTALNTKYMDQYGQGTASLAAGVPMVISSMWERSGLTAWRAAQFGSGNEANRYSDRAWCRMLEWNAGTYSGNVPEIMRAADPGFQNIPDANGANESKALNPVTLEQRDRSIIAWAACKPERNGTWSVDNGFGNIADKQINEVDDKHCTNWWNGSDKDLKQFDWPTKEAGVAERANGNQNMQAFVDTLHGTSNGSGTIASFAFILSSLVAFGVFGLASLAILVAKVAQVLMIIAIFVAGMAVLGPRGSTKKLANAFKSLVGVTVFIFFMQVIFALLSQITNMIQKTGSTLLTGDSAWIVLWTGLSPAVAVFVMHMLFTKVLKIPSPFKISGGLAWAGAAAAGGAAAMGGISRMLDRPGSKLAQRAMSSGRRSMNGALGKVSGGRLGGVAGNGSTGRSQSGDVKPAKTGGKGVDTRSALEIAKTSMPVAGIEGSKDQTGEAASKSGKAGTETEAETTSADAGAVSAEPAEGASSTTAPGTAGAAASAAAAAGAAGVTATVGAGASAAGAAVSAGAAGKGPLIETVGTSSSADAGPGRAADQESDDLIERVDGTTSAGKAGEQEKKASKAATIDPTVLAYSGVNNSGLTQGKMTRAERQQLRAAQAKELADAKVYQKQNRAEMGLGDKPDTRRAKAANTIHNALNRAQEDKAGTARRIIKGTVKTAAVSTGVIAATAVVPWAVPAAVGYYAAKGGLRVAKGNTKAIRNAKNDELVNNYRTKVKSDHNEQVRIQREAEKEARKAAKSAGESKKTNPVTGGQPKPGINGSAGRQGKAGRVRQ